MKLSLRNILKEAFAKQGGNAQAFDTKTKLGAYKKFRHHAKEIKKLVIKADQEIRLIRAFTKKYGKVNYPDGDRTIISKPLQELEWETADNWMYADEIYYLMAKHQKGWITIVYELGLLLKQENQLKQEFLEYEKKLGRDSPYSSPETQEYMKKGNLIWEKEQYLYGKKQKIEEEVYEKYENKPPQSLTTLRNKINEHAYEIRELSRLFFTKRFSIHKEDEEAEEEDHGPGLLGIIRWYMYEYEDPEPFENINDYIWFALNGLDMTVWKRGRARDQLGKLLEDDFT